MNQLRKIDRKDEIKVKKRSKFQKIVWKDFFGDILYGEEFIYGEMEERDRDKLVPLFNSSYSLPWNSMEKFGIKGFEELMKKEFMYECPWTGNTFYWFVPFAIVVHGSTDVYRPGKCELFDKLFYDYCLDLEWQKKNFGEEDPIEPLKLQTALLGHGYTFGTLPSDGSGSLHTAKIALSNGDFIAGHVWVWYNK